MNKASENLTSAVRDRYAAVAKSALNNDSRGVQVVAQAFGYTAEELQSVPAEANMGLSCGNPVATANLRPGEVVVDLGCGGGIDVLLAARKVGPSGKAIGIDMTDEMLERAHANAEKSGANNVAFFKATIDDIPLPDASADCIISNCVINLAPDKNAVFSEMARVLKPGGRLAISDIALKQPLPPEIGQDLLAYIGCIAGAIPIDEYRSGLAAAGFAHVEIIDTRADLNAYAQIEGQVGCCGPQAAAAPAHSASACCATTPIPSAEKSCCAPTLPVAENDACCSTKSEQAAPHTGVCCSSAEAERDTSELFRRYAELALRYNINDYAASVRVFGVKA